MHTSIKHFVTLISILSYLSVSGQITPLYIADEIMDGTDGYRHDLLDIDENGNDDYLWFTPKGIMWFNDPLDFSDTNFIYQDTALSSGIHPFKDYNGDDKIDITFKKDSSIFVLYNSGQGHYNNPAQLIDSITEDRLYDICDFNDDGILDIVSFSSEYPKRDKLYLNISQSSGSRNTTSITFSNSNIQAVRILDYNNDGFQDVLVWHFTNFIHRLSFMKNDGFGQFTRIEDLDIVLLNQSPASFVFPNLTLFDIDNDSDLDIFVLISGTLYSINNLGNGEFSHAYILSESNKEPNSFHIGNYDADSSNEIILNFEYPETYSTLNKFDNNVLIEKGVIKTINTSFNIKNPIVFDVNNDSYLDIISLGRRFSPIDYSDKLIYFENITNYSNLDYTNIETCDSLYTLNNGVIIDKEGVYIDSTSNSQYQVFSVSLNHSDSVTINEKICNGQSFMIETENFTTDGTYFITLNNRFGCDSVITLNLKVGNSPQIQNKSVHVNGCSFVIQETAYYSDTIVTHRYPTTFGCDSLVKYTLIFDNVEVNSYEKVTLGTFVEKPNQLRVLDFDSDGDLDFISSSNNNNLIWLEQTSPEYYKEHLIWSDTTKFNNFHILDIDKDGDFDFLMKTNIFPYSKLLINTACNFYPLTLPDSLRYYRVPEKAIDFNSDGIKDEIFYTNEGDGIARILMKYINSDGSVEMVFPFDNVHLGNTYYRETKHQFSDLNNDGFLDLILATNLNAVHQTTLKLFISKSKYEYEEKTIFTNTSVGKYRRYIGDIKSMDMDNDGNMDLIVNYFTEGGISYNKILIHYNDSLSFKRTKTISSNNPIGLCANTNTNEIITSISASLYGELFDLKLDRHNGISLKTRQTFTSGLNNNHLSTNYAILDFDMDGDLDLYSNGVIENIGDTVYKSNSTLTFLHIKSGHGFHNYVEDVDNDGAYEFVYNGGTQYANKINSDSIGPLIDLIKIDTMLKGKAIVSIDFDNDGDKDVLFYRSLFNSDSVYIKSEFVLLENDGSQNTWLKGPIFDSDKTYKLIKPIDFDLDGDIDLAFGDHWLENVGGLDFETQYYHSDSLLLKTIYDNNDDGNLDILVHKNNQLLWLNNDGEMNFQEAEIVERNLIEANQRVKLMDIEKDGDMDVYVRQENYTKYHALYINPKFTVKSPNPTSKPEPEIEFSLYPNPNPGVFGIISPYENITMSIYSLDGKQLLVEKVKKGLNQFDVLGILPSGLYLATFKKPGEFSKTIKIVIEK